MIMNKKVWMTAAAAAVLTAALSVGVGAEETTPLCREDEVLAITGGGSYDSGYTRFFDCNGNLLTNENLPYRPLGCYTMPKGQLVPEEENGVWSIYIIGDSVEKIAEYPADQYRCRAKNDFYVLFDAEQGEAILYDKTATELYREKAQDMPREMFELAGNYYVAYEEYLDDMSADEYFFNNRLVKIDAEGNSEEIYSEIGDFLSIYPFGNYIIAGDSLLDSDGELVYGNVHPMFSDMAEFGESAYSIATAIRVQDPANEIMANVLDQDLNQVLSFNTEDYIEAYYGYGKYWDGFVQYAPHELLGNNVCSDFLPIGGPSASVFDRDEYWRFEGYAPYALTEGGATVYYNETLYSIPLGEEERVVGIGGDKYITRIGDEYEPSTIMVRQLDTNELVYQMDLEGRAEINLKEDYLFVHDYIPDKIVLYRFSDQTDLAESGNLTGRILPWRDMLWVKRGPYGGLTDLEGNWLIKVTLTDEM